MSFDSVPWFMEGGRHSANVARNVAYAAFGGQPGIIDSTDLEVRELAVPGSSVRVFPGTAAIRNPFSDGEMYGGRNPVETDVAIAATGPSPRSDMVVARVVNPTVESFPTQGWPALDPDTQLGPFFAPYVISNVGSNATKITDTPEPNICGIPLARIDMPASTATVDQAYLTDLRKMSSVFQLRKAKVHRIVPGEQDTITEVAWTRFPNNTAAEFDVEIPEWATHAYVSAEVAGVNVAVAADETGYLGVKLTSGAHTESSPGTYWNFSPWNAQDLTETYRFALPKTIRGDMAKFTTMARLETVITNYAAAEAYRSVVRINVDFEAAPESNI